MKDEELREEMRQEMLEESRAEACYEKQMFENEEYAIEQMCIDEDSTLLEVREALKKLREYGHDISVLELIEDLL